MVKVLAIFPAFDPQINEMAMVWQRLCQSGLVDCTVVASRTDSLKAHESCADTERYNGLTIYRLKGKVDSRRNREELMSIAFACHPEWIFCEIPHYLPMATDIRKRTGARIVVRTDYFLDDTMGLGRRWYLGQRWLRPYIHRIYRRLVASRCEVILSCNPVEFAATGFDNCSGKLQYLPWPHPSQLEFVPRIRRDSTFSVYVGSLSRNKGALVLRDYFLFLLRNTRDFRLALIGPPTDASGAETISTLRDAGGSRVDIRRHCSRAEAIELVSRALFVLSPGRRLGWGLIGDAWSVGTPVIAHACHYDLIDRENCLLAPDASTFFEAVAQLQSEESVWNKLSTGGRETVLNLHSLGLVADRLGNALGLSSRQEVVLEI